MDRKPFLINHLLKGILALLLFFIGVEWLAALPAVTDTERGFLFLFQVILGVVLLISWAVPWVWARLTLSFLFTAIWFYVQQSGGTPWGDWWGTLWERLMESLEMMKEMRFIELDATLRTGFFFLFLLLLSLLLYEEVVEKGRALPFLLLSFVWVGVLDTFFLYDGSLPAVKLFVYTFLILAIQALRKNALFFSTGRSGRDLFRWSILLLTLLVTFSSIGFLAPKAAPSWPDPVSFLQTLKESSPGGAGGMQVTGYSRDDSRLGGGFMQNEAVAFTATVDGESYPAHYWRGESKDTYTGFGWENALPERKESIPDGTIGFQFFDPRQLPVKEVQENVVLERQNSTLLFTSGQTTSVYPTAQLKGKRTSLGVILDLNTLAVTTNVPFRRYESISMLPVIDEKRLIEISDRLAKGEIPYPDFTKPYLSLPEGLPQRVKDLAAKVVGDQTNAYKKVKAIERFLRWGNIYRYETQDVPYPAEGQDFVDQFLFETKRGYCDHFSTSMVVMLRSQGIPARWAKGYAFGQLQRNEQGKLEVTVREKDAHSWVEVYFPEVGWIPFEATASFFPPYEVVSDPAQTGTGNQAEQQMNQEAPKPDEAEKAQAALAEVEQKSKPEAGSAGGGSPISLMPVLVPIALVALLLLLLLAFLLIRRRESLLYWYRTRKLKGLRGIPLVMEFYAFLLSLFERIAKRPEHLTVREYSSLLPLREKREAWLTLTKTFERVRYGEKEPDLPEEEILQMGEDLVKRNREK